MAQQVKSTKKRVHSLGPCISHVYKWQLHRYSRIHSRTIKQRFHSLVEKGSLTRRKYSAAKHEKAQTHDYTFYTTYTALAKGYPMNGHQFSNNHDLPELFAQLGLDSSTEGINSFIQHQAPLPAGIYLADAKYWSSGQASFIREAQTLDSDWCEAVDRLNVMLH